jgi:hypothetical protein
MTFEEQTLRDTLIGAGGGRFGYSILDTVAAKEPVIVTMRDGSTLELFDVSDTLNLLRDFGWEPIVTVTSRR